MRLDLGEIGTWNFIVGSTYRAVHLPLLLLLGQLTLSKLNRLLTLFLDHPKHLRGDSWLRLVHDFWMERGIQTQHNQWKRAKRDAHTCYQHTASDVFSL